MGNALTMCAGLAAAGLILTGILHSLSIMGFLCTIIPSIFVSVVAIGRMRPWRQILPALAAAAIIAVLAVVFLPSTDLIGRFGGEQSRDRPGVWRDTGGRRPDRSRLREGSRRVCGVAGREPAGTVAMRRPVFCVSNAGSPLQRLPHHRPLFDVCPAGLGRRMARRKHCGATANGCLYAAESVSPDGAVLACQSAF